MRALSDILKQGLVWRGGQLADAGLPAVPTGFAALDAELPGGGWPQGVLTELLPEHEGIGEVRALGPALARITEAGRWIAWIAPPHLPYAPALQAAGIRLERVMIVRTRSHTDTLWAIEQALQSNACGAVLGWPQGAGSASTAASPSSFAPSFAQLRRLQIAAEGRPVLSLLFRPPQATREASPAALRLHLQSLQGELAVRIVKRRGGPLARPLLLRPASVVPAARSFTDATPAPAPARLPRTIGINAGINTGLNAGAGAPPSPVMSHAVDRPGLSGAAARFLPARLAHG